MVNWDSHPDAKNGDLKEYINRKVICVVNRLREVYANCEVNKIKSAEKQLYHCFSTCTERFTLVKQQWTRFSLSHSFSGSPGSMQKMFTRVSLVIKQMLSNTTECPVLKESLAKATSSHECYRNQDSAK